MPAGCETVGEIARAFEAEPPGIPNQLAAQVRAGAPIDVADAVQALIKPQAVRRLG